MKLGYITQNEELHSKLKMMGFKRKGHDFFKEQELIRFELCFTHSVHYECHVKYYTITVMIEYLDVRKISQDLNVDIGGFGINIGHLSQSNYFKEWKVPDNSTDTYVTGVITDMLQYILNYAIPYFERYSNMQNVIEDMELNMLTNQIDTCHYLPIMYYISGESEKACIYIENTLNHLEMEAKPKMFSDESFVLNAYGINVNSNSPEERAFLSYKDFAFKLTELMGFKLKWK